MRYDSITEEIKKLAEILSDRVAVAKNEKEIEKAFVGFYEKILTTPELKCDDTAVAISGCIERKFENKEFAFEYGRPCVVIELRTGNKIRTTIDCGKYIVELLDGEKVLAKSEAEHSFLLTKAVRKVLAENKSELVEDTI